MQIRSPIILLGAPRSGTTMLFNALNAHPDLWSLYRESGSLIEQHFPVAMEPGASDVVAASDVTEETAATLRHQFAESVGNMGSNHLLFSSAASAFLRTGAGQRLMRLPMVSSLRLSTLYSRMGRQQRPDIVRIVEKTPENCFRVPLLQRVFPDALFVWITRDPRQSVASIYKGWTQSAEFRRFRFPPWFRLRDFEPRWWSFGLVPGWEQLQGASLMEVCAQQWLLYNRHCRNDLTAGGSRLFTVTYEEAVAHPAEVLRRLASFANLAPAPFDRFARSLPVVNTFTDPAKEKWRSVEREIDAITPLVRDEATALGYQL